MVSKILKALKNKQTVESDFVPDTTQMKQQRKSAGLKPAAVTAFSPAMNPSHDWSIFSDFFLYQHYVRINKNKKIILFCVPKTFFSFCLGIKRDRYLIYISVVLKFHILVTCLISKSNFPKLLGKNGCLEVGDTQKKSYRILTSIFIN